MNSGSMPELCRTSSLRSSNGKTSKLVNSSSAASDNLSVGSLKLESEGGKDKKEERSMPERGRASTYSGIGAADTETDSGVASASNPSIDTDSSFVSVREELSEANVLSKETENMGEESQNQRENIDKTNMEGKGENRNTLDGCPSSLTSKDLDNLADDITMALGDKDEQADVDTHTDISKSSSPTSGIDIAINGIELDPETSNDEILQNLGVKVKISEDKDSIGDEKDRGNGSQGSSDGNEVTDSGHSNGAASNNGATVQQAPRDSFRELSVDVNTDSDRLSDHCTILELLKEEYKTNQEKKEGGKLGVARLGVQPITTQPRGEFSLVPQTGSPDRSHLLVSPVPDCTIK